MNIILIGSSGAMGRVVTKIAAEEGYTIAAGLEAESDAVPVYPAAHSFDGLADLITKENIQADVIIDFSTPALTEDMLEFAVKHKLPIMLATTGHTQEQEQAIIESAKHLPILNTHNTSIGINVMQAVLSQLTKSLQPLGYDIEIIEKHHRYKKDAPSGTAKMLLNTIQSEMNHTGSTVYGREGMSDTKASNEIGVHAIRSGDIVGEHSVIFGNNQESIEISHRAGSKELFAKGALSGAAFLIKEAKPGLYSMSDVLK